jgi:hypothetical protein
MNVSSKTAIIEGGSLVDTNRQTAIKESKMQITAWKVIRWSGLAAMVAGIIFAGIQPIHPADVISSVNTSFWSVITSLKTAMSVFGLLGIAGLYARQVNKMGWLGFAAFLLLMTFYAVQMAYSFAEAFILPLLTTVAPTFVSSALEMGASAPMEMNLGAFATVYQLVSVMYLLGTLLFGIATFRARILSRWAAVLLALAGPLALVMVAVLPHQNARLAAMPMGIALIWLGYSLWSERREPALEPVPGRGSAQPAQTVA